MKWLSLLFLSGCLFKQSFADDKNQIKIVKSIARATELECDGNWINGGKILSLSNQDETSVHICNSTNVNFTLYVKVRSCENCVELEPGSLSAIIVGNVLATVLIMVAVYSLSAQPKTKSFSGNKASDKKTLLNGDDMYQSLTPGQSAEYSALGRKK